MICIIQRRFHLVGRGLVKREKNGGKDAKGQKEERNGRERQREGKKEKEKGKEEEFFVELRNCSSSICFAFSRLSTFLPLLKPFVVLTLFFLIFHFYFLLFFLHFLTTKINKLGVELAI